MITKERLEELIKQNALIYGIARDNEVFISIQLNNNFSIITSPTSGNLLHKEHSNYLYSLDGLFETKREVLHQLEYGNIDKIITLHLPIYETFLKQNCTNKFYCDSDMCFYYLTISYMIEGTKIKLQSLYGDDTFTEKEWTLTEENYELACEECKKLFLKE